MRRLAQLALLAMAAACGATDPTDEIRVTQDVRLIGNVTIKFRAQVTNEDIEVFVDVSAGPNPGGMEFGECSFAVRGKGAFGDMWDNSAVTACSDVLDTIDVAAGETESQRIFVVSAPILRKQVPPGPYDITVYIRLDGKLQSFFAGQIQLPNPSP